MNKLRMLAVIASLAGALTFVAGVTTGCSSDRTHRSTGTYLDDKAISAKVKTELYADPQVKGTEVDVTTYQGTTQLSGFVENQNQKDRAGEIARRVKGVQMVKNDLIIRPSSSTASSTNRIQEPAGSPAPKVVPQQQPAPETAPPQGAVPAPSQRYEPQPQTQPAPAPVQPAPAPVTPPSSPAQPDSSSQY